jgi:CRISPR/Cas system CSM-associated protein Csm3 (group 7 of RAMP superfamily)
MPEKATEPISRWQIAGTLRTLSPLHIGDGETAKIGKRNCRGDLPEGADPTYSTVIVAHNGHPLIPGTSLKGALRSWASAHLPHEAVLIGRTFGSLKLAGLVTFHDAKLSSAPAHSQYRWWCDARSTSLSPQVKINPRTRTAEDKLLYYVEYVPEDAQFAVALSGQGKTQERDLVLYLLENAFRSELRPACLGSESGNGWGRVAWESPAFSEIDLATWLAEKRVHWSQCLAPVDAATRGQWPADSRSFAPAPAFGVVKLGLTLEFEGAMLVNDPSRRETSTDDSDPVSHAMIRRDRGAAYLPSHSVRGAFRGQAHRIWHTVFDSGADEAAFEGLFGATAWRAPIEFSDFELEGAENPHPQEFVAVDRFTGGAAKGKKFRAQGLMKPSFKGMIAVRTDRLFHKDLPHAAGPWVWLLLAWVLRDWAEGDGYIGMGRSKGYGAFRLTISSASGGAEAALLKRILERDPVALQSPELEVWKNSLNRLRNEEAA